MKIILFPLLYILLTFSSTTRAEDTYTWEFYSGNEYLKLIEDDCSGIEMLYIAGLNDALNIYRRDSINWINKCSTGKTMSQLAAIFKKWLDKNPERWHAPAAWLYVQALEDTCK